MTSTAKLLTLLACAAVTAPSVAFAATSQGDGGQKASNSCPAHMVMGSDGTCVQAKTGRMGFDLAAPGDDNAGAPPQQNTGGTRSVSQPHTGSTGHY